MFKIVIAEDEFLLQKALQKIITGQTGYEISFTASNGARPHWITCFCTEPIY